MFEGGVLPATAFTSDEPSGQEIISEASQRYALVVQPWDWVWTSILDDCVSCLVDSSGTVPLEGRMTTIARNEAVAMP